jgi:hypothetical protein
MTLTSNDGTMEKKVLTFLMNDMTERSTNFKQTNY